MKNFIRILGMKKKHIILHTAAAICTALCTSCSDYLDKMPDNRATVDTEEKITSLLVSAYPNSHYALIAEMSSDNTDKTDFPPIPPSTNYKNRQLYGKTSPKRRWIVHMTYGMTATRL